MGFLSCWSFLWDICIPDINRPLSTLPESQGYERRDISICALPDHLLLWILQLVPIKDAVATSILSKRWRYVWTMLPKLLFKDQGSESHVWFIEKSLQLHKAPKLMILTVELGPRCTVDVDVDVGKWVVMAVNRGVLALNFQLLWTAKPTSFPKSLYTCDTLVDLTLSNEILVDVSSPARLPSLLYLTLNEVVYKDEDSLVRLLSSSPVLKYLAVERHEDDNLTNFIVKVPSLKQLYYITTWRNDDDDDDDDDLIGWLVIDSPALTDLTLVDEFGYYCLIENMPCLDEACIDFDPNPDDKFLTSLSSVRYLHLCLTKPMVEFCSAINFSWLIKLYFLLEKPVDWLESLMFLLQNSPKLKTLMINTEPGSLPPSWNQPSSIPGCLSSHLEMFGWKDYGGRQGEKQLVTYILANSKCLKTVEISLIAASNLEENQMELESLPRSSTSSQLLFPTQMEWEWT